jgi:uncharacterized protein with NRDE domain
VTRQGRIAVLTNYREQDETLAVGARSRGLIPNAWLKSDPQSEETSDQFARRMIEKESVKGVGGFSLVYGFMQDVVRSGSPGLGLISNRTPDVLGVVHLASGPGETHALSNAAYCDRTWPKVINGEEWTKAAIAKSVEVDEGRDQLVSRLLKVLSTDSMPRQKQNEEWDMYLNQLRHSIFIPAIGKDDLEESKMPVHEIGDLVKQKAACATDGVYGTQKNIIIMVNKEGKVYYFERTLYDRDAKPIKAGQGDRTFEYQVEGW